MRSLTTRTGAVAALAVAMTTGGLLTAMTPTAGAAPSSINQCNTPVTGASGKKVPGMEGARVPCTIIYGTSDGPRSYWKPIATMQRYLNSDARAEAPIAVDGNYGPETREAVKNFQQLWNGWPCTRGGVFSAIRLAEDGYWGPQTSKAAQQLARGC